jgi:hypothetical protein
MNSQHLASSYQRNHLEEVFEGVAFAVRPELTVEIGILEGFSAFHLSKHSQNIILCDLFEKFPYKHADRGDIEKKFPQAEVRQMDFYTDHDQFQDNTIDLLHIDIANNGDTFRHFLKHYYPKLKPGGVAILEGGSEERDGYWWMKAFNKPSIRQALAEFGQAGIEYHVIEAFPSLTIVRK